MEEFFIANKLTLKGRNIVQEAKQLFERFPLFQMEDKDAFFATQIHTLQDNLPLWEDLEYRNSIHKIKGLRQYPINYYEHQGGYPECMYFVARYFNTLILGYYAENELEDFRQNRVNIILYLYDRSWIEAYYGELEKAQAYLVESFKQMMTHFSPEEWRPDIIEHLAQVTKLIQERNTNPQLFNLEYGSINQLLTTGFN